MLKKQTIFSWIMIVVLLTATMVGCAPAAQPAPAEKPAEPAAAEKPAEPAAAEKPAEPAAEEPAKAPEASTEAVTLTIWTGFPELEPLYKATGDQLTALHPNVKIEFLSTTLREFEQKLQAALPTGTGPDVFDVEPNLVPILIESALIDPNPADVEALVKSGIYREFDVNYFTYDGKTYGIPMMNGSLASLYYNKDMFKEVGLDPEKPPATYDEMMEYAKKLVKYDDAGEITRSGMSMRLSGQGSGIAEKFWFFLHNMGGDIIVPTKDGTKWHNGYDNEGGQKALKYYIDAVYTNHVDDQKVKHDAEAFETGQTAMLLRESWVIGEIASKAPDMNYGVAPMLKDVKWDTLTQPAGVYVSKSSKNPDLAWEYAKLLTSKENAVLQVKKTGWLSVRGDVDWNELLKESPQYEVFVNPPKEMGYYAYPLLSCFDEIITKMADRLVQAYLDTSLKDNPDGIAKTIHDIAEETDSILKQAGIYGTD